MAAVLALVLMATACSDETAETTSTSVTTTSTTTTQPTTTTTRPTTTTTTTRVDIEGVDEAITAVIERFYDYATGISQEPPAAPEAVVASIEPGRGTAPATGEGSVAAFAEQPIAAVSAGRDLFLLVGGETGWRIVAGSWPGLGAPAYYGEAPRVVAVIGSDARPGEHPPSTRADSIHFVALDGAGGGAVAGMPRDSWVPSPGGGKSKVTNVLARHGPDGLLATLKDTTGLPLEGYVLTGFAGFTDLVGGVLGGVEATVPFAINDRWAKANLSAGTQVLDGAEALAFSRARKTVPGGDFTRSSHQGVVLIAAAKTVRDMGPLAIPGLMEAAEPHIFTDLSAEQLLTFSALAIAADLDGMPNVVAPGSVGRAGSASVVFLGEGADELWSDLADGTLE